MGSSSRHSLFIQMLLAALLLLAGAFFGIRAYGLQKTVPAGVTVGGIRIGGLPIGEAERLVQETARRLRDRKLEFISGYPDAGGKTAAFGSAGLRWDTSPAEAALKRLREGGPFRRAWQRYKLRGASVDPVVRLDEAVFRQFVAETWAELHARRPVSARRLIAEGDQVHIIPDVSAYRVDESELMNRLLQYDWKAGWSSRNGGEGGIAGGGGDEGGGNGDRGGNGSEDGGAGEGGAGGGSDGRGGGDKGGNDGNTGDSGGGRGNGGGDDSDDGKGVAGMLAGPVRIELPLQELSAKVTAQMLFGQGIDRKISEFATSIAPGDEGRRHNIASAAKTIHDRLLAPGEVFDYAPAVKETENRFGFREAPVIYNGKLVPGIGGGICQVSSTLYNAVLRSGLEIVERRSHSLPVSYVPLGQDATFSDGYINFRFRNNSGFHLLIRTETSKDRLKVKLFGRMPPGIVYEIESVTVEELEVPVKTVVNPDLPPGRTEILLKGKPGYIVETYRTKKQNGTILSKERISRDRYLPQPELTAIGGTASGSPGETPDADSGVLEDGVSGPRFR